MHAMILKGSGTTLSNQAFLLQFDKRFIAKTAKLGSRADTSILIPGLPHTECEEYSLCPVRAITTYLDRFRQLRKLNASKKLFISYKLGFVGDVSAVTISRWIKNAILWAYQASCTDQDLQRIHQVKAHDVRAMSASLSLLRSVGLEQILTAAGWRSHNVFTSYYLRDLSVQSEDLLRLGPLVSSQTVVQTTAETTPRLHTVSASHTSTRPSHSVVRRPRSSTGLPAPGPTWPAVTPPLAASHTTVSPDRRPTS